MNSSKVFRCKRKVNMFSEVDYMPVKTVVNNVNDCKFKIHSDICTTYCKTHYRRFKTLNMLWGLKTLPINLDVDIRPAIREISKEFNDLKGTEINRGIARALNEMIGKSKVQASRSIRDTYKVKSAYIKDQIKPDKATRSRLTATLRVVFNPMPVYAFSPRQTDKGVTVNIMGKKELLKSAFIAKMGSGHIGVFARGTATNNSFIFRTKRVKYKGSWDKDLPIDEIITASPFQMVLNKRVAASIQARISKDFPNVLVKQLQRVRAGY